MTSTDDGIHLGRWRKDLVLCKAKDALHLLKYDGKVDQAKLGSVAFQLVEALDSSQSELANLKKECGFLLESLKDSEFAHGGHVALLTDLCKGS